MATIGNSGLIVATDYQFGKLIDGSITKADIPKNISSIRAYAFYDCNGLLSVNIPQSIKTIGTEAFNGCDKLETLTFEDNSVLIINKLSFGGCAFRELKLPEGLTTITYQAFRGCSNLNKIYIPATTLSVANRSFESCTSLYYIFYGGTTSTKDVFMNCNNIRLFDMRFFDAVSDKGNSTSFAANNIYLYINVPDNLYSQFTDASICPNWSALKLKRFVHSCDVASFDDIQNPVEGDYYSLKGDTNYLNPLGEKQIDIRQYTNGQWVEIDIG